MKLRKLPRHHENPIDNIAYDISTIINRNINNEIITPNFLTTISFFSGLLSAFFVYQNKFLYASIFHSNAFLFDCMDGNNARMYNKCTSFGDWYDHTSDKIREIILVIVILWNKNITIKEKITFIIVVSIAFIFLLFHMGCQERNVPKGMQSTGLKTYTFLCRFKKYINFSRFFGCGTFNLIILIFLLYFYFTKKNIK